MINTKHKPLNKEDILKNISLKNYPRLSEIEILEKTESTNNEAKDIFHKLNKNETSFCFIAEEQTSGRGTKGRKWISPYGTNIYLSLAWKSSIPINKINGLSLAVAVTISEMLNKELNLDIKIKWPNDLILKEQKVGGILIETSFKKNYLEIVIGVGLNVLMKKSHQPVIEKEWTSIFYHTKKYPDRNRLSGLILDSLLSLINNFKKHGLPYYKDTFEELNFLKGRKCQISTKNQSNIIGKVLGINKKGELLLKMKDEVLVLRSIEDSIIILS